MVLSVTVSIYFISQEVANPTTTTTTTTTTFAPLAQVVFCSHYFRILCDEKTLALDALGVKNNARVPFPPEVHD